ncbi:hypothetical protein I4U23_022643 [Adineta vaga]|nr:hypothetical protein I4U23_022643 [Adineta vaga]
MEWTYISYTIANYGITFGLVLMTIIGVFATYFSSKKGQEFVIERVIGINPAKAHDTYNDQDMKNLSLETNKHEFQSNQILFHIKQRSIFYIGIFCCLLGGMTLSITAVLMFQGCFLTDVRLIPGDNCPEYPMDCFVFAGNNFVPITHNATFLCQHMERAQFPNNISDVTAWCYAWIIRFQSTKSILDQLGIAIALVGFFTTMLAVIVYLGKSKKTVVLSILYISSCSGLIIILLIFKWSFAPLTYAILSLGITLGIFGLVLFCLLSKAEKKKNNVKFLTNQNRSILPVKLSSQPKIVDRSSRVIPI